MAEDGVQRKLAAILAADVVGYSRMMSEDEAGTLARMKAHRHELFDPKVKEYRGRTRAARVQRRSKGRGTTGGHQRPELLDQPVFCCRRF